MPFGLLPWSPTAFTMFDWVLTNTAGFQTFSLMTGPAGEIIAWNINSDNNATMITEKASQVVDKSVHFAAFPNPTPGASNRDAPGTWTVVSSAADTGSTLSLMTLAIVALNLVTRR